MLLPLPELSLVLLVGASGSGKSTFARRHFRASEILSSDAFRAMVADDENDQSATPDAFEALTLVAAKRLAAGRFTVIDATNVQREARRPLIALARRYHAVPAAIVFDLAEPVCLERNHGRIGRTVSTRVIGGQIRDLRRSLPTLREEGIRVAHMLHTAEEVAAAVPVLEPLPCNRRSDHGPFDIIGDVHGCTGELELLLHRLGYQPGPLHKAEGFLAVPVWRHPAGRRAVFLGDLVDRGPRVLDCVRLVAAMIDAGQALCVQGNHDRKLARKLAGREVSIGHGLEQSLAEVSALPGSLRDAWTADLIALLEKLPTHYVLDAGRLVVAHAGLRESMHGRASREVREFALYGQTTGESDEFGLPIRLDWAADYHGSALVAHGHTPVPESEWHNRTINLDTGCVFGGKLTALRYPERDLVSVPATRVWHRPVRRPTSAMESPAAPPPAREHESPALDGLAAARQVVTRLAGPVRILESQALTAVDALRNSGMDPRWLVYLPPVVSAVDPSGEVACPEHPGEAFDHFRAEQVERVVVEELYPGPRVVMAVCRTPEVARTRFGVHTEAAGAIWSRLGTSPFTDAAIAATLVTRLRDAITRAELWDRLETDWLCLEGALRPAEPPTPVVSPAAGLRGRPSWPVRASTDVRLTPFHLLASRIRLYFDRDHMWHMEQLHALCNASDGVLTPGTYRIVELNDLRSEDAATAWWQELAAQGAPGVVVKPFDVLTRARRGWTQPALKVRAPAFCPAPPADGERRSRTRALGIKRSRALRQFALGAEALDRFIRGDSLVRVLDCVHASLALNVEPSRPQRSG